MAHREALGRLLPRRRVDARPNFATEVFAKQDTEAGDEALREPANTVAGRACTARRPARYRTVHGPPHPHGRAATPGKPRNQYSGPKLGYAFVHPVIDDHSRVAYTEVHDDETAMTAAVLHRTGAWFAERGVTVDRVLSDNGSAYRSHLWRETCEALSINPKRTRLYRPQTNGKVERFHRTMADGWAYARCYTSEQERRDALPDWLHQYDQHRPHTACGNQPPFSRLINVPDQYI